MSKSVCLLSIQGFGLFNGPGPCFISPVAVDDFLQECQINLEQKVSIVASIILSLNAHFEIDSMYIIYIIVVDVQEFTYL